MKKVAKDSPTWLLLPGHRIWGKDPDISGLPKVFSDDADNKMLWGTLGAVTSAGVLSALMTTMANRAAKKRLEKRQQEVHKAKVDALYPSAEAVGAALTKAASDTTYLHSVIPVAAAVAAGVGAHALTAKGDEDAYAAELDARITEQKKKLDELYKKLENIYSSGDTQTLEKKAGDVPLTGRAIAVAALGLIGAGALGGVAGYKYARSHSDEEAAQKVLEENLLAENLTNIPDNIAMQLDPRGK